jgi:hypothetical protein
MGNCTSQNQTIENDNRKRNSTTSISSINNELMNKGEVFYLVHRELEKIKANIVGGKERVEIYFSIKNAENIDPYLLSFELAISGAININAYNQLGNTGKINTETLIYPTTFIVDYLFECHQHLNITIIYDNKKIGMLKTTLGRIFGAKSHTAEFPFQIIGNEVVLVASVHAVPPQVESKSITFNINGKFNINRVGKFAVIISNSNFQGKLQKIYKTKQVTGKELDVVTTPLILNDICKGDENQTIIFEFYEEGIGLIETVKASLMELRKGILTMNSGICTITFDIQKMMQFVDYIEAGLQISVLCGIDYTGSNGIPNDKTSLHYLYGTEPNHYEQAMRACCSIVAYYDYDQMFPVFGFGATIPGQSVVQHCFNTNLTEDPNCLGVDGILDSYKHALKHVNLSGPTHFSPLIKGMTNSILAANNNASSVYYILMILTDGCIHDMEQTKNSIYEASFLPLSIIIIGVGEADFSLMEELDGDRVALTNSSGKPVNRDIVQFVKYNEFKIDINRLAAEVLAEVPKQVQQYYAINKNFKPII